MASFRMEVRLQSALPELSNRTAAKLSLALKKLALQVEAEAKVRAPVKTGALKNSIQANDTDDPLTKEVNVGVNYGIFVEMGTVHSAAQPYLTPAVEKARDTFNKVVGAAIEEAANE